MSKKNKNVDEFGCPMDYCTPANGCNPADDGCGCFIFFVVIAIIAAIIFGVTFK